MSEVELVYDDFTVELSAVEQMVASLSTTGAATSSGRARVAAANAAILLLAAIFEEYVRQTVKATFVAKSVFANGLQDFPAKLPATVWRRSLERLSRTPFDDVKENSSLFDDRIKATVQFCLSSDLQSDVADILAHNDNNMRPAELNRLFSQIGLGNVCGKVSRDPQIMALLGCETSTVTKVELEANLEDFFRRRNEIAHAISLNSSTGPASLATDIALFKNLGRALSAECKQFSTPPPRPPASPATAPDTSP